MNNILKHEGSIWSIADTLRSVGILDAQVSQVMMPFFGLIMIDSRIMRYLEQKKPELMEEGLSETEIIEELKDEMSFYNSMVIEDGITLQDICFNDTNFNQNFQNYLDSFDKETKMLLGINPEDDNLNYLNIQDSIKRLKSKKVLFSVVKQWANIPLKDYNNSEVTTLEEHIKRKWADISAGQFYTPSDVIDLIQGIILKHTELNKKDGYLRVYDPTCGGGNMVFGIEDKLREQGVDKIITYGQEIEDSLYALAKIESKFRVQSEIKYGNTLTTDMFETETFDYIAANPPYGYSWKDHSVEVKERGQIQGCYLDKYPSESDGQLLFLQHIAHKTKNDGYAIVVSNGSPLFSGDASSGESEIRKWFFDNNYIDAIIQLPKEEFYNTKISTYLWIINKNRPSTEKRVKMIDASSLFKKLSKSKGDKSVEITPEQQEYIINLLFADIDYMEQSEDSICKIYDKEFFYFNKQSIMLNHKDINGKSIEDILPSKIVKGTETKQKSIILNNVTSISSETDDKMIEIDSEGNITSIYDFEEIEGELLKDRAKRLQDYVKSIDIENLVVVAEDQEKFYYDKKIETIVQTPLTNSAIRIEKGNGVIKVSISYKKATKTKEEGIEVKVELLPKLEKDYEVIPFQEEKQGHIVNNNIDNYLQQWVEQDYEKLDNVVGVEINFNKIFYKYEKLRNVNDIFSDIKELEEQELKLDNDIFDLSSIELSEEELKSLED